MLHSVTSRPFDFGLTVYEVRVGNVVAVGTAPQGGRPATWTVSNVRRTWSVQHDATSLRGTTILNARALSKALQAVESGRV